MLKNLVFIVKARQDFIRYSGDEKKKNAPLLNSLFESISEIYIPLLNMFEVLEKDNIPCKIGLVLPPLLCTLLEEPEVQDMYLEYLENEAEVIYSRHGCPTTFVTTPTTEGTTLPYQPVE